MILEGKTFRYEWQPNFGGQNGDGAHSHGGITEDNAGNLYFSFNEPPYVRVFNPAGGHLRDLELAGEQIHCLAHSTEGATEYLWTIKLGDNIIGKYTLDGTLVNEIDRSAFGVADDEKLMITALSVDPTTGNVWVADGYGLYGSQPKGGNRIYCFNSALELQFSFDGTEAACGSLKEPHWILVDTRKATPEIYIADRSHHRIVVYSNTGKYLRQIDDILHTPSGLALTGDYLVCAELKGRVHVIDKTDTIVDTFADGSEYTTIPGWPNRKEGDHTVSPLPVIDEGKLNSPHGVHADAAGNIFIHEWLLGVRITKMKRLG